MIKLKDFLSDGTSIHKIQAVREKVYNLKHDSTPMVWVYNEQYKDDNLLFVFRSAYIPRISLTERMICKNCGCVIDEEKTENIIECTKDLLNKNIVEIYVMLDGIAVCVSDK